MNILMLVQKSTDNYFPMTFRKREREKMKIRKNNQKKEESYDKIKEAGKLCEKDLLSIMYIMEQKESLNNLISEQEKLIFLAEKYQYNKELIPEEINKRKSKKKTN